MMRRLINTSSEQLDYSLRSIQYRLARGRRNELRKVLVNGSPKTGTTWMLKLLESIPGYRGIGNFKGEISRYNTVQAGDVIHGHDWYTPELAQLLYVNQIRTVLMVRDPRDQLVSRVYHIRRDTTHAWHTRLNELSMDEAIALCIEGRDGLPSTRQMIELNQSWINGGANVACTKYEDLLFDTFSEMQRVLEHLEICIPDALLESIITRNRFERLTVGRKFWRSSRKRGQSDPKSHFRKGITGDWKNHLKEEHIKKFKLAAGDKLVELGYEKDLNW